MLRRRKSDIKLAKGLCVTAGCTNKFKKPKICEKCREKARKRYRENAKKITCAYCGKKCSRYRCADCYKKSTTGQLSKIINRRKYVQRKKRT